MAVSYNTFCAPIGANSFYGAILGGFCNTVSGCYSSVLGGRGNTVSHNYSAAFGNGISSASTNTFHVDCMNIKTAPAIAAGLAVGTVAWKAGNLLGPLDKVLVWR